jgi:hypothetical protein
VVVAPAHPALHLTTLAAPCNTNTTQEIKKYPTIKIRDWMIYENDGSFFMATLRISR